MSDILDEAKDLASLGVKELCVIAQDTTRYGEDIYGTYCLDSLLSELSKIDGISDKDAHEIYEYFKEKRKEVTPRVKNNNRNG